ncbi:MAG: phosphate acyltransferase PlsX [Acidimicrobiia bacterium]|nr:phosphate acyltransferase PlsX [Acidimicrobiia bacterium]
MPRIAFDAMGGDFAPHETVQGAVRAAKEGVEVILVGDEAILSRSLDEAGHAIPVVHAPEVIEMSDDPATAIRTKKNASISVAARLVANGEAEGLVSAGSTGAAMAAAAFIIGRLEGVQRPAIGSIFPTRHVVLDAGANLDCKPEHLLQFGVMGSVLAEIYLGIETPTVGLLNIGEERGKGRELERAAFRLLEESALNFVGNVEGRDLGRNNVDVLVTDGFTGNVLLKGAEGIAARIMNSLTSELRELQVGADAPGLHRVLSGMAARLDPETYGGAHLVGTKGVVVIGHGSSSRTAIANALRMASDGAAAGLVQRVAAGLSQ